MLGRIFLINGTLQTALAGAVMLAGCFIIFASPTSSAEKIAAKGLSLNGKAVNDSKFHKQLLRIADEYKDYSKVDDMKRWAPWLCAMPPPPKARSSKATDASPHGKKLYYLFAKHRDSYMKNEPDTAGQVVVKEAWVPPSSESVKAADDEIDEAKKSGKPIPFFKPDVLGTKSGLFIMYKTDSKTPDTDEGWIYGTVTADGKTVTSAGRVESCMGCHVSAPHGRLFGLQN